MPGKFIFWSARQAKHVNLKILMSQTSHPKNLAKLGAKVDVLKFLMQNELCQSEFYKPSNDLCKVDWENQKCSAQIRNFFWITDLDQVHYSLEIIWSNIHESNIL